MENTDDQLVLIDDGERIICEYNGKYITNEITVFFGKPGTGCKATIHVDGGDIQVENVLFQRCQS